MTKVSLEEQLGASINIWFGGATIDVHATLDAMLALMASIAVKAGCTTDERVATLADHMKSNLTMQLNHERALADNTGMRPTEITADEIESINPAAKQAFETGEPVRPVGLGAKVS